ASWSVGNTTPRTSSGSYSSLASLSSSDDFEIGSSLMGRVRSDENPPLEPGVETRTLLIFRGVADEQQMWPIGVRSFFKSRGENPGPADQRTLDAFRRYEAD